MYYQICIINKREGEQILYLINSWLRLEFDSIFLRWICPVLMLTVCWQSSPMIQRSFSCDSNISNHKKQRINWWLELSWIQSTWKKREEIEKIDDGMNKKCHGGGVLFIGFLVTLRRDKS